MNKFLKTRLINNITMKRNFICVQNRRKSNKLAPSKAVKGKLRKYKIFPTRKTFILLKKHI